MHRTASIWLVGAVVLTALLYGVAWCSGHTQVWQWIGVGVAVSVVTLLASNTTVAASGLAGQPLQRMLMETSVRLALPLSFLLAVAIVRRDLLSETFLLYFLPFQFLTIVADVAGSLERIDASKNDQTEIDPQ